MIFDENRKIFLRNSETCKVSVGDGVVRLVPPKVYALSNGFSEHEWTDISKKLRNILLNRIVNVSAPLAISIKRSPFTDSYIPPFSIQQAKDIFSAHLEDYDLHMPM